jgi:hypothetical protein
MVVLHVTPCLAPAWACGVSAQRVAHLARAQAESGADVIVLTTDASAPHERVAAGEATLHGVRVIRVRTLNSSSRWSAGFTIPRGFGRAVSALLDRSAVDVVHLHEVRTVENASVTARVGRRPLVLSLHDGLRPSSSRRLWARLWDQFAARRVLTPVRHVIADRAEDVDEARALWGAAGVELPSDCVHVVPPPGAGSPGGAEAFDARAWSAYERRIREVYARTVEATRPSDEHTS